MRLRSLPIQLLLTEDRASDRLAAAKKRYPKIADDATTISAADPDPDKANVMWIARQMVTGNIRMPEDTGRVRDALMSFMRLKRIGALTGAAADLLRYKALAGLEAAVEEHLATKSKGEVVRTAQEDGAESIYKDKTFEFVRISTQEAATKLLKNTHWCVKDPKFGRDYFTPHRGEYPIMVLKDGKPWALIDSFTKQAKGVDDEPMSFKMVDELMPVAHHLGIERLEALQSFSGWHAYKVNNWDKLPEHERKSNARLALAVIEEFSAKQNFHQMTGDMVYALSQDPSCAWQAVLLIARRAYNASSAKDGPVPKTMRQVLDSIPEPILRTMAHTDGVKNLEYDLEHHSHLPSAFRDMSWREAEPFCKSPIMARMWVQQNFLHHPQYYMKNGMGQQEEEPLRLISRSPEQAMRLMTFLDHHENTKRFRDTLPQWFRSAAFKHSGHTNEDSHATQYTVQAPMSWEELAEHDPTPAAVVKWVIAGKNVRGSGLPEDQPRKPDYIARVNNPAAAKLIASDVGASRACIGACVQNHMGETRVFRKTDEIPEIIWDKALSEPKGSYAGHDAEAFEDMLAKRPLEDVLKYGRDPRLIGKYLSYHRDTVDEKALRLLVTRPAHARDVCHSMWLKNQTPPDWLIKLALSGNDTEEINNFLPTVIEQTRSRKFTAKFEERMKWSDIADYLAIVIAELPPEEADKVVKNIAVHNTIETFQSVLDNLVNHHAYDTAKYIPKELVWLALGLTDYSRPFDFDNFRALDRIVSNRHYHKGLATAMEGLWARIFMTLHSPGAFLDKVDMLADEGKSHWDDVIDDVLKAAPKSALDYRNTYGRKAKRSAV